MGPWFLGRLMAQRPLGLVGAGWVLAKVGLEWEFVRSPGSYVMGSSLLGSVALPLTLCTAWAWSSWCGWLCDSLCGSPTGRFMPHDICLGCTSHSGPTMNPILCIAMPELDPLLRK